MIGSFGLGWLASIALLWAPAADETAQGDTKHPPLVVAAGPVVGPNAIGNQDCRATEKRCETRGSFFGAGFGLELRPRLYRSLYAHARPWIVSNVAPDKIYRGATGLSLGLGAYGQHAFIRGEYSLLVAFGDNKFTPPFFEGEVASDTWGHHAGMLAAGFRKRVKGRVGLELWGGPMFGPFSERRYPDGENETRRLITFMVGLGLFIDDFRPRARAKTATRSPSR